ncbi:hypothetical protein J6TS7_56520 [Paenibacillus dendritiformis]|uniref:hypothetical protein n=1 Tax=Paenibacillus dendritiformis TaxID=130049 RepID=UPI001B1F3E13|nr:hypothetical protein [Paenibacillus dendritiformis]GIO82042.1 hypothetical protein J6TS7_56520 [Paenibacillus dendritiformis]
MVHSWRTLRLFELARPAAVRRWSAAAAVLGTKAAGRVLRHVSEVCVRRLIAIGAGRKQDCRRMTRDFKS